MARWAVVDFLWADVGEVLDSRAALGCLAPAVDEGFFLGVEALSCADNPPACSTSRKARKTATKRNRVLTLFSVARFPDSRVCPIRYKMGSHP